VTVQRFIESRQGRVALEEDDTCATLPGGHVAAGYVVVKNKNLHTTLLFLLETEIIVGGQFPFFFLKNLLCPLLTPSPNTSIHVIKC